MHFWTRKVARAFIYDVDKKQFLIAKGSLPPFNFHLPGGGVDNNETTEQALRRELMEELQIQNTDILTCTYIGKSNEDIMYIHHDMEIFFITVKNPVVTKCWEISTLTWVPTNKLHKYISEPILSCLDFSMVK